MPDALPLLLVVFLRRWQNPTDMSFLVAAVYDTVIAHAEWLCLARYRKEMLSPLGGRILELGSGTGRNLPHYGPDLERLVLAEPDPHMRRRLRSRIATRKKTGANSAKHSLPPGIAPELSDAPAESLPFASGAFNHVVSTLVFCSVQDLKCSLAEAYRVLAPGGTLVLMEHVAAVAGSRQRKWQDFLDPIWSKSTGGCHLNRDPRDELARLGFQEVQAELDDLRGAPGFQRVLLRGTWRKV